MKCETIKGVKFVIDSENNTITWDTEGYNRKGSIVKLVANTEDKGTVFIAGAYAFHPNGYSYCTPTILKEDITKCDSWDQLESIFLLS